MLMRSIAAACIKVGGKTKTVPQRPFLRSGIVPSFPACALHPIFLGSSELPFGVA